MTCLCGRNEYCEECRPKFMTQPGYANVFEDIGIKNPKLHAKLAELELRIARIEELLLELNRK
jgi:hypothetical protein